MCCTGRVKREGILSEESGICDRFLEGSASVRLVSENSVAESGIRDGFLSSCDFIVCFSLLKRVCPAAGPEKKVTEYGISVKDFEFMCICVCL